MADRIDREHHLVVHGDAHQASPDEAAPAVDEHGKDEAGEEPELGRAVDGNHEPVFEEAAAPGRPYGITVTGDALRVVVGDSEDGGADDRFIRRYIMGKAFKTEAIRCPAGTGSFLAYDGDRLYLSQRDNKCILELDEAGAVLRTISVPRQVTGMVIVAGKFYLVTTQSRTIDDYRLLCIDARKEEPAVVELATIPFGARSLGFDGTKFWTNCRAENTLVAFAKPA